MRNRLNYFYRIQRSIDYIEENLNQVITLEDLASRAFFSPFHFHRIFQMVVGDTVMDYIRKRRLACAARYLIGSPKNILDIAVEYQFNTHNSFIRAFKKEYGITPKQYRNFQKQLIDMKKWEKPKEGKAMMNLSDSSRLQCSKEDKLECLELLFTIISLSQNARKRGLLALEKDIEESWPFLLRKGMQYILDGTDPGLVREMMTGYLIAGDYQGKEFLARLIIIEGILGIQAGEYPKIIQEKLGSFFGEDFAACIDQRFGKNQQEQANEIQKYIREIGSHPPMNLQTSLLEEPIRKMNHRSCQRLLRDVELSELVCALQGASGETVLKIFGCLSKDVQMMVIEESANMQGINPSEIIRCQKKILDYLQKLRTENEILS
jgi:AraC-like DNA-binding protein